MTTPHSGADRLPLFLCLPSQFLALSLLAAVVASSACRQSSQSGKFPVLTAVQQVRNLAADDADRGYPGRLHAGGTYYDPDSNTLILQHSPAGFLSVTSQAWPSPKPGNRWACEGFT